jgi:uncharacterized protein YegJ (DUF2314 family)
MGSFPFTRRLVLLGLATPLSLPPAQLRARTRGDAQDEAIALARRTLPHFWERLRANEPQETGYALKIAFSDQHGSEDLWVTRLRWRGSRLVGAIDTNPRIVRSLRRDQETDLRADAIIDWMYFRNGLIVGNATGRAALRGLKREEAERLLRLYE